tara:strand:- start:531 stop:875 length:345 start_codon:yes stop_codon:yes gene_type:complete
MSTTFGVKIPSTGETIEVARRRNGLKWINEIGELLPDEIKVEALDNSPQGIHTIGDIKDIINHQVKMERIDGGIHIENWNRTQSLLRMLCTDIMQEGNDKEDFKEFINQFIDKI